MKQEKRKGLIAQIYMLVLAALIAIGVITNITQFQIHRARVKAQTGQRAAEAAGEVIASLKEYPAWTWLLAYWAEHAGSLEIEYDAAFTHGTAAEEKSALFSQRHPDLQLRYCDRSDLESLPEEDQQLYAEIIYSWLITRLNAIKQNYGCDYLYCMITDTDSGPRPYETQFFIMSAADPGAARGTAYEEAYTLGVEVSVKDNHSTQKVMREAVEKAMSPDEGDMAKRTVGESLRGAGNYLDYYTCMELSESGERALMVGATYRVKNLYWQILISASKDMLITMIYQLFAMLLLVRHILSYVVRPLKKVIGSIRSYTVTKDSKTVEENLHDILTSRKSFAIRENEIGQLTEDFVVLTKEIDEYTAQIEKAATERERMVYELETAAQIQLHMLPEGKPQFPDHPEFELCASMTPAKMVGGDFYDYFLTDRDHLALVMADVSDKGIPAALFMAEAKALIKIMAQTGREPAEVLTYVNNQLNETNDGNCFVTVWLAIIDLRTGEGLAVNAGHEHPALSRKGEDFELIVYKHNLVVGMLEGITYRQHAFRLNPGDRLFVYTDGVPEASNVELEQFGTDRMLEALNRTKDLAPEELLASVSEEIDAFMGQASRFDDTTMMCFHYIGS